MKIERIEEELRKTMPVLPKQARARVLEQVEEATTGHQVLPVRSGAWWKPLRIGAVTATFAAIAIVLVSGRPRWVAQPLIQRVEAAVTKVHSAQIVVWTLIPGAARHKSSEVWYQNGRWRIQETPLKARKRAGGKWATVKTSSTTRIFTNGKLWTYDQGASTVTVRPRSHPFDSYWPRYLLDSGFSLNAIIDNLTTSYRVKKTRVLSDITANGQVLQRVIIELVDQPQGRLILIADKETHLPVRIDMQMDVRGKWTTIRIVEMRFNQPLPARLFEPNFPKSAKISTSG